MELNRKARYFSFRLEIAAVTAAIKTAKQEKCKLRDLNRSHIRRLRDQGIEVPHGYMPPSMVRLNSHATILKEDARAMNLAYGFLRGLEYQQIENRIRDASRTPHYQDVYNYIYSFASFRRDPPADGEFEKTVSNFLNLDIQFANWVENSMRHIQEQHGEDSVARELERRDRKDTELIRELEVAAR